MKFNPISKIIMLLLFSTFAQANVMTIEPQALIELIDKQQTPLILDVRTATEFKQGHIQGAINIPYDKLAKNKQLSLYKNQHIVLYCRSGRRAQIAAQILQNRGFENLIDLNGHMISWQKGQYPLVID